ncbi:MAG: hypothetical protein V4753_01725 [Pseudomonadota bacterium]
MLVDGRWAEDWQPVQKADEKGRFVRQTPSFRNWITADGAPGPTGTGGFKAEAGRYRLYVALICPRASRTLIAQYPRLSAYMLRILRLPGVTATVNLDHITRGYYSIKTLNPNGIRPTGPAHVTEMVQAATL